MDQIRITCGQCGKRYRLPGNATGYLNCRKCDLVMPITRRSGLSEVIEYIPLESDSEPSSIGPDQADADSIVDEIILDPQTDQLIHVSAQQVDAQKEQDAEDGPHIVTQWQQQLKRNSKESPADTALKVVGVATWIAGMFVLFLQFNRSGTLNGWAAGIGLVVCLIGVGFVAAGTMRARIQFFSVVIAGVVLSLGLFLVTINRPIGDTITESEETNEEESKEGYFQPRESKFDIDNRRNQN